MMMMTLITLFIMLHIFFRSLISFHLKLFCNVSLHDLIQYLSSMARNLLLIRFVVVNASASYITIPYTVVLYIIIVVL